MRPGDAGEVVDPGRHRLQSLGVLAVATRAGRRFTGARRGVRVRLDGGPEVELPPAKLEVLPRDHPLAAEPDAAHGDWLLEGLSAWEATSSSRVDSFVPAGYPAVVRLLHPWPDGSSWAVVADALGLLGPKALAATKGEDDLLAGDGFGQCPQGEFDLATARALVEVLTRHTTTPEDVFVAVWEGWGDIPPQQFPGAARLASSHRGHMLLRGPLRGVLTAVGVPPVPAEPVTGLWWPRDRAWVVGSEIDFEWTFVAASEALANELLDHEGLEVLPTSGDAPADLARDDHATT